MNNQHYLLEIHITLMICERQSLSPYIHHLSVIHVQIKLTISDYQSLRPHLIRGIFTLTYSEPTPSERGTDPVAGPRSRSWWGAGTVLGCLDPPCVAEPHPGPASDNGDNCSHCLVHSVRHSNCSSGLSFHSSTSLSPLKHEREISTEPFYRATDTSGICLGFFYLSDTLCYTWLL